MLAPDEALMGVRGFNAAQVQHGSNERGGSRRTNPVEIRGAFSFETGADTIGTIGPARLADMCTGAIRCLATPGRCPQRIAAVLDATDAEATPTDTTDAVDGEVPRVSREKRPDVRATTHAKTITGTVCGWKRGLVCAPGAQIPLALASAGIHVADTAHASAVLEQARRNGAGDAVIRAVALDRGVLDGALLARIAQDAVVSIPAKSTRTIPGDAREIARRAEARAAQGNALDGCPDHERSARGTPGPGKQIRVEERKTPVGRLRDLPCDWWKPGGATSAATAKRFEPKRGTATVVLRWDGAPTDADRAVGSLDTDPAAAPCVGFAASDDRSLIEHPGHREATERWVLAHHPQRSEAGGRVHASFVFLCMAVVTAFRLDQQTVEEAESRGEDTGIGRSRRPTATRGSSSAESTAGSSGPTKSCCWSASRGARAPGEHLLTSRSASTRALRYCGRECSAADLACLRRSADGEPGRTRRAISRLVGEEVGWRKPDGGLKDMSCRVVLLRMQREGLVRLPAPRHRSSKRRTLHPQDVAG